MTHITPEAGIEETEHQAKKHIASLLGYLQQIHDGGQYRCAEIELEKVLENVELLTKNHRHQLQKARHDWLREERGRLEGMKHKNLSAMETGSEFMTPRMYRALAHNQALQTIIDRYQAELDQARTTLTQNSNREV